MWSSWPATNLLYFTKTASCVFGDVVCTCTLQLAEPLPPLTTTLIRSCEVRDIHFDGLIMQTYQMPKEYHPDPHDRQTLLVIQYYY